MRNQHRTLCYAYCLLFGLLLTGVATLGARFLRHTNFAYVDALLNRRGVINYFTWWSGLSVLSMAVVAHVLGDFRRRLVVSLLVLAVFPFFFGFLGYALGLEQARLFRHHATMTNNSWAASGDVDVLYVNAVAASTECLFMGGVFTFLSMYTVLLLWVRQAGANSGMPMNPDISHTKPISVIGWAWVIIGSLLLMIGLGGLAFSTSVLDSVPSLLQVLVGLIALPSAMAFFKRKRWSYRVLRMLSWLLLMCIAIVGVGWLVLFVRKLPDSLSATLVLLMGFVFIMCLYALPAAMLVRALESAHVKELFGTNIRKRVTSPDSRID